MLSKTLTEEAAWKFTKENGIDMVTINPGLVIGPLLQPTLNTSSESVLKLINGTKPGEYGQNQALENRGL
uniref:NAD-dependent epimerase/dehydratase domain-containing protein n=1 Tax=Manihot esculenta TaxID=3983 RepID=A0A199UBD2_MANES